MFRRIDVGIIGGKIMGGKRGSKFDGLCDDMMYLI